MKKKIYIIGILCLCFCALQAQKMKVQNQPYGDQRLYHFGISVGANFQDMLMDNTGYTTDGETWYAQIPNYSPGFTVGILANMYLNPYMSLRTNPSIHFGDKAFLFTKENTEETYQASVRSNYLMVPFDIKFATRRLNNYRPYFLAGIYAAMDLGRKKGEALLTKPMDYGFELGFGCDFYLPIVKVCPEIKFCFGLADILEKNRSDLTDKELLKYSNALSKGNSRMVVITFNFE